MTSAGKIITGIVIGVVVIFALVTMIDVDMSGDLRTPNVEMTGGDIDLPEIETSGGEMPNMDVNTADVEVERERATVDVPTDIDVETEERTMSYPTLDYESPENADRR